MREGSGTRCYFTDKLFINKLPMDFPGGKYRVLG